MEDGGREFLLDVVDRFPLRGGVRRQPRTPRSGPSRCAADGQSQPCCTDTRDWQDLRGNRRCVWCGALKLAGPVLWLVNWIGDEAEGWDDVGNMFAIGVLAESHPQERSRSPSTNSKHSEDAGEQVVQLVAGDGSYSGGTTETKKLDDLYSRDTEIVADSDVLQHSDTMLEEEG